MIISGVCCCSEKLIDVIVKSDYLNQEMGKKWAKQVAVQLWLQLQGAIYRSNSFVLMLRYCANLKAIRYESTSLKRIVADKSRM